MRAVHVRNAVMLGQRIVEHGEVRLDKIQRAEVVGENVLGKGEGFLLERFAGGVGEIRVQLGVDGDVFQRRQAEPLMAEMPGKSPELGILAHACDLLLQDLGPQQLSVGGEG